MYDQYGNKLVRKAIPYQLYDMAGLQQWFEEMSAKGFLLDSFGIRTGIFRVGEPAPGVRYRLEPQTYWDQSLDYDKNKAYDGTLDLSEWFDEIAAMLTPEG